MRYLLTLLLLPGVLAFGVSPGIVEYDFVSGGTYKGYACINDAEGMNITLSISDDYLITDFEFDKNHFISTKYSECVNYTFKTVYFVDPSKTSSTYIYAEESLPEARNGAFSVRVGQQLAINTTDAPIKEDIPEIGITFTSIALGLFIIAILILFFIRRKRN